MYERYYNWLWLAVVALCFALGVAVTPPHGVHFLHVARDPRHLAEAV